ncbi:hypothetical protein MKW92_050570, partial [Papaver armeniacum]
SHSSLLFCFFKMDSGTIGPALTSVVNLGFEVYMQADARGTRNIFVDVGLGFHVELTWSKPWSSYQFVKVFRSCSNLQHHDPSDVLKVEDFIGREHWCRRVH